MDSQVLSNFLRAHHLSWHGFLQEKRSIPFQMIKNEPPLVNEKDYSNLLKNRKTTKIFQV
jgi:hypothetical protein